MTKVNGAVGQKCLILNGMAHSLTTRTHEPGASLAIVVLSPRGELLGVWSCGTDAAEHCKTLPDSFVRVRALKCTNI